MDSIVAHNPQSERLPDAPAGSNAMTSSELFMNMDFQIAPDICEGPGKFGINWADIFKKQLSFQHQHEQQELPQQQPPEPTYETVLEQLKELATSSEKDEKLARTVRENVDLFTANYTDLPGQLHHFTPERGAAAHIVFLGIMFKKAEKAANVTDQETCLEMVNSFLSHPDVNIRQLYMIADYYGELMKKAFEFFSKGAKPNVEKGVRFMAQAIDIISAPGETLLTTMHSYLFRLALQADNIALALPYMKMPTAVLNENMVYCNHNISMGTIETTSVIAYFYYYAVVVLKHTGDKKRAASALQTMLSLPHLEPCIEVALAVKRFVLLQLILGRDPLSTFHRTSVYRIIKGNNAESFVKLAQSMSDSKRQVALVQEFISECGRTLQKENLMEFAEELRNTVLERKVLRIAKCFLSIRMQDLAMRAELRNQAAAKELLDRLVEQKKLTAKFEDDVVYFDVAPPAIDIEKINNTVTQINEITQDLERVLHIISTDSGHITRVLRLNPSVWDDEGLSMQVVKD